MQPRRSPSSASERYTLGSVHNTECSNHEGFDLTPRKLVKLQCSDCSTFAGGDDQRPAQEKGHRQRAGAEASQPGVEERPTSTALRTHLKPETSEPQASAGLVILPEDCKVCQKETLGFRGPLVVRGLGFRV